MRSMFKAAFRAAVLPLLLMFVSVSGHAQAVFDEAHILNSEAPTVARSFTLPAAGAYDVTLADLAQPGAFSSLRLIVTQGAQVVATLSAAGTLRFNAAAGESRVLILGNPNPTHRSGSFSVAVLPASSSTAVYQFADTINLPPAASANPNLATFETEFTTAMSGTHQVSLIDFAFPAALQSLTLNIVAAGGGSVFTVPPSSPGIYTFSATPGSYRLFVIAEVATSASAGSYGVQILAGADVLLSEARTVNKASSTPAPGFTFDAQIPAAGSYRLTLADFQFPAAFQGLTLNVTQAGTSLGGLSAAGTLDFNAAAGRIFVSVVTQRALATQNGLFGVNIRPAGGGAAAMEVTQGVGALFRAHAVDVTQAGSYDAALADLSFPAAFAELTLAVTRGSERIGYIFGAGGFSFNATPGRYFLNFIASPNATAKAGTYALRVGATPPAPTVTLSAAANSVSSGGSTQLNWSTTNATACTASGAWSGSKTVSGSQSSGALNTASNFTLTCTGPGGSTSQTVTVAMAAANDDGGGGGMLDMLSLFGLGGGLLLMRRRLRDRV